MTWQGRQENAGAQDTRAWQLAEPWALADQRGPLDGTKPKGATNSPVGNVYATGALKPQ